MNSELLKTLQGLRADPTLALSLYPQLCSAQFWVLVQKPVGTIEDMMFLTYRTKDGLQAIPAFTNRDGKLLAELLAQVRDVDAVLIEGKRLWKRLLDIVKTKVCEVEVDPGEYYGIRLNREMILGMMNKYGSTDEG